MAAAKFDVRLLGVTGIEDFHAHLMRLDRASRFPGMDDRAIDAHCLSLISGGAILVGAYVGGVMRAGAEVVPDRTGRRGEAAITVEQGFDEQEMARALTAKIIEEANRHHFSELCVMDQSNTSTIRIPAASEISYAANG